MSVLLQLQNSGGKVGGPRYTESPSTAKEERKGKRSKSEGISGSGKGENK